MQKLSFLALVLFTLDGIAQGPAPQVVQAYSATNSFGPITNQAVVLSLSVYALTNILPSPWAKTPLPPTTLPVEIQEKLLARRTQTVAQVYFFTNYSVKGFVPE